MSKKKLIIIGAGGNGLVARSTVHDINKRQKEWEFMGYLDDNKSGKVKGGEVIGDVSTSDVEKYIGQNNVYFVNTLISASISKSMADRLDNIGIPAERFANIVHPTSVVSKYANIGNGVCIHPFVSVGPDVSIENHVQIYANSLIGHGSTMKRYSYIANNACVGAHVRLETGAYLGTNSSTLENISIGEWGLVGMGAVVIDDVEPYTKVAGNPAKVIGER